MPTQLPDAKPNERALREAGTLALDPSGEGIATDETRRLIASNKVEGTAVYDRRAESIGTVHNFMVDKVSGQVAYVVLAVGGFLGLGEEHHPVPWKLLRYDARLGGYVLDIDADRLAAGPRHGAGDDPFADPRYGEGLDDHYGGAKAPTA
jgi:sporulation protein YlmC with PRC-barrel domain